VAYIPLSAAAAAYIPLSAAAYIPLSAGGGWRLPGVVIYFTNYSYCFVFVIFFLELSLIIRVVFVRRGSRRATLYSKSLSIKGNSI
jgi:hypothetical protein